MLNDSISRKYLDGLRYVIVCQDNDGNEDAVFYGLAAYLELIEAQRAARAFEQDTRITGVQVVDTRSGDTVGHEV